MTITILTSLKATEYLKTCNLSGIESVSVEENNEDPHLYWTTIKFADYYDSTLVGATMFAVGITYGLDLQYSSYGTEPERVR
jgi:hypothetical protein